MDQHHQPADTGTVSTTWLTKTSNHGIAFPHGDGAVFLRSSGSSVQLVTQTYANAGAANVTVLLTLPAAVMVGDRIAVNQNGVAVASSPSTGGVEGALRTNLDRHPNCILAACMSSGT